MNLSSPATTSSSSPATRDSDVAAAALATPPSVWKTKANYDEEKARQDTQQQQHPRTV